MWRMGYSATDVVVVCLPLSGPKFLDLFNNYAKATRTRELLSLLDAMRDRMAKYGGKCTSLNQTTLAEECRVTKEYCEIFRALFQELQIEKYIRINLPTFYWTSYTSLTLRVSTHSFCGELCMVYARLAGLYFALGLTFMRSVSLDSTPPEAVRQAYTNACKAFTDAAVTFFMAGEFSLEWQTKDTNAQDVTYGVLSGYARLCSAMCDVCNVTIWGTSKPVTNVQRMLLANSFYEVWQHLDQACFQETSLQTGALGEYQQRLSSITRRIVEVRSTKGLTYNVSIAAAMGDFVADHFERLNPPDPIRCVPSMRVMTREKQEQCSIALMGETKPTEQELAAEFPQPPQRTRPPVYETAYETASALVTGIVQNNIKFIFSG